MILMFNHYIMDMKGGYLLLQLLLLAWLHETQKHAVLLLEHQTIKIELLSCLLTKLAFKMI